MNATSVLYVIPRLFRAHGVRGNGEVSGASVCARPDPYVRLRCRSPRVDCVHRVVYISPRQHELEAQMAAEASAADAARRNADAALRDLTIGVRLKEELIKTLAHSAVEAEQAVAKCVGSSSPCVSQGLTRAAHGVGC